jgi:arylsulfatase
VRVRALAPILVVLLGPAAAQEPARPAPPNIVLVLADDMGFSDIGCYGGEIRTPTLDRLAADGVRFTRFYNAGRCCPTRASLLTGLYQHQSGLGHMTGNLGVPAYQGHLRQQCATLGEVLQAAGYLTMVCGKWHVGANPEAWPQTRGFHYFYGTFDGGVYFKEDFAIRPDAALVQGHAHVQLDDDFYITEALTQQAIEFVDRAAARRSPFFLYLAHIAPHLPLQARPADIARYRDRYADGWDRLREERHARLIELGILPRGCALSPRDPAVPAWSDLPAEARADLAHRMAVYAAQVDAMDQGIGKLRARLEHHGLLANTLLLFLSDNGGNAAGGPHGFNRVAATVAGERGSYASYGQGWSNASNTPFRRHKTHVHEGGIATPLIVHWPAGIARRGALEPQFGHVLDLLPTCVEVSRGAYPAERAGQALPPPEGRSLRPAFGGQPVPRPPLFWEHEGNRAVRAGDWKLVAARGGPWELYDLAADPTEVRDLAAAHPERVRSLARDYEAWAARVGALPWPVRPPKADGGK